MTETAFVNSPKKPTKKRAAKPCRTVRVDNERVLLVCKTPAALKEEQDRIKNGSKAKPKKAAEKAAKKGAAKKTAKKGAAKKTAKKGAAKKSAKKAAKKGK